MPGAHQQSIHTLHFSRCGPSTSTFLSHQTCVALPTVQLAESSPAMHRDTRAYQDQQHQADQCEVAPVLGAVHHPTLVEYQAAWLWYALLRDIVGTFC